MSSELQKWTGKNWIISLSQQIGDDTLYEKDLAEQETVRNMILDNDLVKSVLDMFESADISDIRRLKNEFETPIDHSDFGYLISSDEFGLDDDD